MTNKQQLFRMDPYWDINKIRVGGRMSRWCSQKITHHNIHGNQANNNTKINIGHSFKDTEVKLCHFKSSSTKQNFPELPLVIKSK